LAAHMGLNIGCTFRRKLWRSC